MASILAAEARNFEAAHTAPASELIYDWVDDSAEGDVGCQVYEQCLHIKVLDTEQCAQSVSRSNVLPNKTLNWKLCRVMSDLIN